MNCPPVLCTVLCLIFTVFTILSQPIHATSTDQQLDGLQPVTVAATSVAFTLMKQSMAAYSVDHQLDSKVVSQNSPTTGLLTGSTAFSTAQSQANPQLHAYPMIGNAMVPVYNLPASAGVAQLIIPVQSLCDIMRGNITRWNDPRLVVANPDLVLPAMNIHIIYLSSPFPSNDAVTGYCGKIDPLFAKEIPHAQAPVWPTYRYASWATGTTSDIMSSLVIDKPGSFAMCTLQNVLAVKAKVAALKKPSGVIINPTINAISLNILELGTNPIAPGGSYHDLTAPESPNAWPICTLIYLWIDVTYPTTTCATKTAVLKFILWFYQSASVKLLANALNMAIVPDLYTTQTNLLTTLQNDIVCQGAGLISSTTDTGFVEGFGAAALMGSFFNFYGTVNTGYSYQFHATTERLATQRAVAGEIDLALVNTKQLSQTDLDLMVTQAGGVFIPAFMVGVSITFSLPSTLSSKWPSWNPTTSTLPALLPLYLDVETVAGIFAGKIHSWLDPAILATSPQLLDWFNAYGGNTLFQTIVCCSNTQDQQVAGLLLLQGLNGTDVAKSNEYKSYFKTPLSWTPQIAQGNFTLVDTEPRNFPKASSLPALGQSAISYRLITGNAYDQTTEFTILQKSSSTTASTTATGTSTSGVEKLTPTPDNFKTCAEAGWKAKTLNQPSYSPPSTPVAGCYPFASPISFGLNLKYENDECSRGNESLNLFSWIVENNALSLASLNSGAFRIADLPEAKQETIDLLNSATCDGKTLLITVPEVWEVNTAIHGFGIAILVVGLTLFVGSAIGLIVFRTRTVLRSSSVPFLGVILVGLALLIFSVPVWSGPVAEQSCQAFMFMANLGFSLVFVPFFAKTYRIYMIFSRQQLKVVKMSNKKLMLLVVGLILLELILLISWSQLSPLQPITYLKNIGGTFHQATHCSVEGSGMTFVVIEAIYKSMLLIAGTVLAFSTRKVSTAFNESSAIAFSIYNVLFSSVVIGGIIYFVSAFEDTLILLFVFLIAWVAFVTWGLLFGAKFWTLFSTSEQDALNASKMDSLQTEKSGPGGFSFVSVASMPVNMIKSYIVALESQLVKARKQLTISLGTSGQGIGIGIGNKKTSAISNGGGAGGKYAPMDLPGQVSCGGSPNGSGLHEPTGPAGEPSVDGTAKTIPGSRSNSSEDSAEKDVLTMKRQQPTPIILPQGLEQISSQPQWHGRVGSMTQTQNDSPGSTSHTPHHRSWTASQADLVSSATTKEKITSPPAKKKTLFIHANSSSTTTAATPTGATPPRSPSALAEPPSATFPSVTESPMTVALVPVEESPPLSPAAPSVRVSPIPSARAEAAVGQLGVAVTGTEAAPQSTTVAPSPTPSPTHASSAPKPSSRATVTTTALKEK